MLGCLMAHVEMLMLMLMLVFIHSCSAVLFYWKLGRV